MRCGQKIDQPFRKNKKMGAGDDNFMYVYDIHVYICIHTSWLHIPVFHPVVPDFNLLGFPAQWPL